MEHRLKTWPEAFQTVLDGTKTAEWREDDRGFEVGDTLLLQEFLPSHILRTYRSLGGGYTGQEVRVTVTHILRAPQFGIPKGFVVMSIRLEETSVLWKRWAQLVYGKR